MGMANNTPRARITAATLIQGAHADIHSHRHYHQCPLTLSMASVIFGMTVQVILPWMQLVQRVGESGLSVQLLISVPLTIPCHSSFFTDSLFA
jgi:hypothetical protein